LKRKINLNNQQIIKVILIDY